MKSDQKEIKIKVDNYKYIFSTYIESIKKDYIVILAHGFTGYKDEHIFLIQQSS